MWQDNGGAKPDPLIKPYLKWAGGKRQLLREIKKHLPQNTCTYYEPFIGAGALFFELQPQRAVINDFNTQLILTYTAIKENVEELIGLLKDHKAKNSEAYFYAVRNLDRDAAGFGKLTSTEKAARMIFLNKTCYNGLYRVNSKGLFNVPYGRYNDPAIYNDAVLRHISRYLNENSITILNEDFENVVASADEQSFVYFDPPYHRTSKTTFTGYQAGGFGEEDQRRLCEVMVKLTGRGVKCLLSNADTGYIRSLYSRDCFDIIPVRANRAINSNAAGRGAVDEVLVRNWRG
jgi:DNA adenine methylase